VIRLLAVGILAGLLAGCGGSPPAETPEVDPQSRRETPSGPVVGLRSERGAHVWRGLPFARPPIADLRWRAPRPPQAWTELREALDFGDACPQFAGPGGRGEGLEVGAPRGSEDCLYTNVFAPPFEPDQVPQGENRLPVMVWIHGGGNSVGSARIYDGSQLAATHEVIVVTVQYRLGVWGWFSHPALRDGADALDGSGNYGTLDLIRALEWVRDHVSAFGGDPDRVTIFGESAGGSNVFSLLRSPLARGLFHRAIAQSGGNYASEVHEAQNLYDATPPGDANSSAEVLLRLLVAQGQAEDRDGARQVVASMSANEVADFLRELSVAELLAAFDAASFGGMYRSPQLIRDGVVLPDVDPKRSFEEVGGYNAVPVMLGTNRDENRLFLLFGSDYVSRVFGMPLRLNDPRRYELDSEYQSLMWKAGGVDEPATAMRSAQGASVYGYRFDWDEEPSILWLDFSQLLGAAHGLEIPFVFGTLDLGFANRFLFDEERRPAAQTLSDAMMSYWTHFAYTGTPDSGRVGALPSWSAWSGDGDSGDKYMILDTPADGGLRMSSDTVTERGLIARVGSDARLESDAERCELYAGFVQWSASMTADEYETVADGACRAWPIADAPL
jgi:para-nitrobenzyl esterase